MLPLSRVEMITWADCEPGDLIFTNVRGDSHIGFIFDVSGNKSITYLTGEVAFVRHQLNKDTVTDVTYRLRDFDLQASISVDMVSARSSTTERPKCGDLCIIDNQSALVIEYQGEEFVIGLNGHHIGKAWGAPRTVIPIWKINFVSAISQSVQLFAR